MRSSLLVVVFAIASTADAAPMGGPWALGLRSKIHAAAVDGGRAYLATGDNRAELVVVDIETGSRLGTFDAAGGADALSVKVSGPGIVKLGRRLSDAPEIYRLDVSDPANVVVLETGERARHVRWKPDPLPPVRFLDVNGDGVYRLGCLGDSNTAEQPFFEKWCELLRDAIGDPRFEVVNVAVKGATATPNRIFESDATEQMAAVLERDLDAVVFAFGTNDRMQGRTPSEILGAYLELAEVAVLAGVTSYVATTPPTGACIDDGCPLIGAANDLLHDAFGDHAIDFFRGFGREHLLDPFHLTAAGQALRAARALAIIGSPLLK